MILINIVLYASIVACLLINGLPYAVPLALAGLFINLLYGQIH